MTEVTLPVSVVVCTPTNLFAFLGGLKIQKSNSYEIKSTVVVIAKTKWRRRPELKWGIDLQLHHNFKK